MSVITAWQVKALADEIVTIGIDISDLYAMNPFAPGENLEAIGTREIVRRIDEAGYISQKPKEFERFGSAIAKLYQIGITRINTIDPIGANLPYTPGSSSVVELDSGSIKFRLMNCNRSWQSDDWVLVKRKSE